MTEVEELVQELSRVQDELLALPDDAFAEIYRLQQERDELRERAAAFVQDWDAERASEELLRELASVRQRLKDAEDAKIDLVMQAGGGGAAGGGIGLGDVSLNQRISEAQGVGELRARIGRLKGILIDRGVDVPD